ncbi:MAG: GNAT family N-acetyltransferase, partial [Bacilli bacterium]|nr:GNAT family N-acetyltransferase [Bacilli bacterium]
KVAEHYLVGKFNYDWEKEKVWQYKKLEKANNEDVFQWSIILKSENKCIGQASCQKSYDEFGNENSNNIRDVGWFLDFNYHGMGYGSEAARAMIDYMFKEIQIDKIETCAATDNLASWKIMEKLGFHRTNKIKKVKYTILTEEVDCYCYEITREEYLNLVSK